MNHHSTAHGSIIGVVASVPARVITNADCPDPAAADEAAKLTGVRERRWVTAGQTAYDLNLAAAKRVMAGVEWAGAELDLIVYVTQTPTRAVPADVYSIAAELGATCPCMQINWSCSGYVYGLWTAMRMIAPGQRALLIVGDATSTIADKYDRATGPLFGDAGSATAIVGGGQEQHFVMGSDGGGAEKLCTHQHRPAPEDGDLCDRLYMDGAAVFSYTLRTVVQLVDALKVHGEPDYWLLHNANAYMLRHLGKKAGIGEPLMNIERFGNTSCASIPLLMTDLLAARLTAGAARLGVVGFGAGWAHAAASINLAEGLKTCQLIDA